ncbi:class II aldolase/adducin family protein [Sulfoacidibacillus thermotolerans]|uniref:Class II aldolase/adducin N-terminal domain-containing protein n=1 Tax=Sulfoacidibacillus thermotolerans TaxID=1765684 RepID=A0A2U3D6X3_SULT2|nr:class II aldolase/adducin family protein [Sulfoacidibacillus thermotolerans]PWI57034.1 hypothetical protein BM613_10760 [Sulfoacidibacillus thermotolerans]
MYTLQALDRHQINRIVEHAKKLPEDRLVTGTSGNISCRLQRSDLVAITPTGVPYEELTVDHISIIDLTGNRYSGLLPSSETPMHLGIYRARKEVKAIVHTHSIYATTLAVQGLSIPSLHYLVAALGGTEIPITSHYAPFGSEELAHTVVLAMAEKYNGVLLRNHGALTVGHSVEEAYKNSILLEEMAELYYRSLCIGKPTLLTINQMENALEAFKTYGKQISPQDH